MQLTLSTLFLLPLLNAATPLPDLASTDSAQGMCGIRLTGFGDAVQCIRHPSDPTIVYKFTGKPIRVECYIAGAGRAYYRTVSPNGNCYVEEKDMLEGSLCRGTCRALCVLRIGRC
jgi:hypothetical protein